MTQPVQHANLTHAEPLHCFFAQRLHLLKRHLLVSLIVQMQCPAAARVVAHNAVKHTHRPIPAGLDRFHRRSCIDDLVGQPHPLRRSPAHRGQQGYLVPVFQHPRPLRVLLVDRHGRAAQRRRAKTPFALQGPEKRLRVRVFHWRQALACE